MKKGFTLMELIVVFAIIGILAAIVITLVSRPQKNAQVAAVRANLQAVHKQAEIYYINNSSAVNSYGSDVQTCSEGVFGDSVVYSALLEVSKNIDEPRTLQCQTGATGNTWAVLANKMFVSGDVFCADSSGYFAAASSLSDGLCVE